MSIHEHRIDELRARMQTQSLGAFFVTHLAHVAYLTGFSGSSAMLILTPTDVHFLTDGRYGEQAKSEIVPITGLSIHIEREWWRYIAEQSLLGGAERIGFEAAHTSVATAEAMKKRFERETLVPMVGVLETIVMRKTREEVDCIKAAADIAAQVYAHILSLAKAGMSEQDLAAEIAYVSRKLGSEGEGFDTIVASGKRGALPHGRASAKILSAGELVTLDFGCRVRGFYSDMTRTFALGEPTAFDRSIFHLVLEANKASIHAARGGINVAELDTVARRLIADAGYEKAFEHGLGHGLGREVHEKPNISWRFPDEIAPTGAVITIEPGVYVSGRCGVRIEDDVWLTEAGCEVLTHALKELIVVE